MRKITYTQMRAELSDILDAVRNGDTIVVTQRGRPDTVLNATLIQPHPKGSNSSALKHWVADDRIAEIMKPKINWGNESSALDEMPSISETFGKPTFQEALQKTQLKHAKIIKALEDK